MPTLNEKALLSDPSISGAAQSRWTIGTNGLVFEAQVVKWITRTNPRYRSKG